MPFKISSAGFITGAICVIGSLLMPHAAPTSDLQEMLKPLGEHEFRTEASSLLVTIGFLAMMIGITGVYRSISEGGMAWAHGLLCLFRPLRLLSRPGCATASVSAKLLVDSKEAHGRRMPSAAGLSPSPGSSTGWLLPSWVLA
jgi:hypothetical protein